MRLVDGVDLAILDGEAVAFASGSGRVVALNPPATAVLQAVLDGHDPHDVAEEVSRLNPEVDGRCVLAQLVDAGVLAEELGSPLHDDRPAGASEPQRPGCSDPVGRHLDAPGRRFELRAGSVSVRSNDRALVDAVAAGVSSAVPASTPRGWALTLFAAPGVRGPRRFSELRICGRVVTRVGRPEDLASLAVEWLAHFHVTADDAGWVPLTGAVAVDAGGEGVLEVGTVAEDLRLDRRTRPAGILPVPGLVLGTDGAARLPAAHLGWPGGLTGTGIRPPTAPALGVPPGATAEAVLAAAVPPHARTVPVATILGTLRAFPRVEVARARTW